MRDRLPALLAGPVQKLESFQIAIDDADEPAVNSPVKSARSAATNSAAAAADTPEPRQLASVSSSKTGSGKSIGLQSPFADLSVQQQSLKAAGDMGLPPSLAAAAAAAAGGAPDSRFKPASGAGEPECCSGCTVM